MFCDVIREPEESGTQDSLVCGVLGGLALTLASGMHSPSHRLRGSPGPLGLESRILSLGVGCAGLGSRHSTPGTFSSRDLAPAAHEVGQRGWAQTEGADPTLPLLGGVPTSSPRSLPPRCFGPRSCLLPGLLPLGGSLSPAEGPPCLCSPALPPTHTRAVARCLLDASLENVPCVYDCQQKCLISCCGSSIYPSALVLLASQNLLPSVNLAFPPCHC